MSHAKIFTVHDAKAAYYTPPFFARTSGEAMRIFSEAINDPQHHFAKHYTDFTLFEIGEFDDLTGCISSLEAPRPLGNGVDFKTVA